MPAKSMSETTPIHKWTNGGTEVLIVKCVNKDGTSYDGFRWPLEVGAVVNPEIWDPVARCGNGLHGWPWGLALGDGKDIDWTATWIVFGAAPDDVIDLGGKCKARTATVRFVGDWHGAMMFILNGQMAWAADQSCGAASNSGYGGAASNSGACGAASNSGYGGAASNSGDYGAASNSGDYGAASNSGACGAASNSGDYGAASNSGYGGAASSTKDCTAAISTGLDSRAMAGRYSCIALAWWNKKENRGEMRCAEIGCGDGSDGKLKAVVWYRLDDAGNFIEA
jgi:hypothetical protein